MLIVERPLGDVDELHRRSAAEPNALRRDRYRAVLLALGGREASDIAASLGRARRSVQDWAYAYRDGGVDAVQPRRRLGRARRRLPRECEPRLRARLDAGPTDVDGGAGTLRGRDVVRILESEFGVRHTLNGAYLYAAVEPATGESVALLAPNVDAGTMSAFLAMLSAELKPADHAVLILDGAGWHKAKALVVPDNVTCLILPPYSPELNPAENVWHYLRSHHLSNRAYADYDELFEAAGAAWRQLTPERLRSVCRCAYLERAQQT